MVAPVDSKVELEVEGETITLRLNFRSISLLEEAGLDLFSPQGIPMTIARSAVMCRLLAVNEHPDMTDEEALAYVTHAGAAFGRAVIDLINRFGGAAEEPGEGNALRAKKTAIRQPQKTSSSNGAKRATNRTASGSKRRAASN